MPANRLAEFRERYNRGRPHWALEPQGGGDVVTPQEVYVHGCAVKLPKWQGWAKAAREKLAAMVAGAHLPTNYPVPATATLAISTEATA